MSFKLLSELKAILKPLCSMSQICTDPYLEFILFMSK